MGEQEQSNWSISLGRWNGVNLRLHCFFLLFAVCTLYLAWNAEQKGENDSFISIAAVSLGVLLVSGLLHELGHLQAAIRLGGQMDQIILAPFVGIAPPRVRSDAHAEFVCHAAGPLINLLVCLVCAPLLWSQSGGEWWTWLHPLQPAGPVEMQNVAAIVPLVFWINWVMLLLNLLPVFPFDGGRMMRAAILIAWPGTNPRLAVQLVAGAAKTRRVLLGDRRWLFSCGRKVRSIWCRHGLPSCCWRSSFTLGRSRKCIPRPRKSDE